jgi:hypothetical protein
MRSRSRSGATRRYRRRAHDLGGPLALAGTLRMTPEPGFVVDGTVAARPTASPNLVRQLQMLGAPDAQGRRSFSIANTF